MFISCRVMRSFDIKNDVIKDRIAYYPISEVVKGKKRGYIVLFPSKFVEELKNAKIMYNYLLYVSRTDKL